ncbi:MAG: leucine--tRNA ligase [bacterium]|nr:leucine--tRNA ligase [bacterium]
MNDKYDPSLIEKKWQKYWEDEGVNNALENSTKEKYYALIEFPYPSGDGLHVGHPRPYIGMDIIARKRRLQGYNVLYPIGWDAFGLPTENYAIKTGKDPRVVTKENSDTFRRQIQSLGISFDWSREINTADPKYYKWTQWIFLQFLKHDLAYKAKTEINWCPKDKIGLANEEVIGGMCERCGTAVEKKEKEQWILRITKYAERLEKDLDGLDYQERIKLSQKNWIGKSEGAEISFKIKSEDTESEVLIFTTRPDTIYGATYLVLSPEHKLISKLKNQIFNQDEVFGYIEQTKIITDIERTSDSKEKTGVEVKGVMAINPATKEEIPIWVADYVLPQYGTGAIMAVPSDDERDQEFAQKFNLPIIESYQSSGFEDFGSKVTRFKLRDWIFSRQRYWGEPIPVIHCDKCGTVPVPEKDLPVELPNVDKYEPTETGESPLANISEWVNVKCPTCDSDAKRETDVMPNWAGSSWYFMRYTDPHNDKEFASQEKLKHWMPVDWYNGGMEHTTLHLLYSRFWNKFLFDIDLVPTDEPYKKRTSHGLILAEGGEKMSKSKGNVINPDDIIGRFGADTLRIYEMFMGPFDQTIAWNEDSLVGPRRFIEKVWKLKEKIDASVGIGDKIILNQTIQKVSNDIEEMKFNTAISTLMVFTNALDKQQKISKKEFEILLLLLSPFAPHVTSELWEQVGNDSFVSLEQWPKYDDKNILNNFSNIAIQINGKTRSVLKAPSDISDKELEDLVMKMPEMEKWLKTKPQKVIIVPKRVVNILL